MTSSVKEASSVCAKVYQSTSQTLCSQDFCLDHTALEHDSIAVLLNHGCLQFDEELRCNEALGLSVALRDLPAHRTDVLVENGGLFDVQSSVQRIIHHILRQLAHIRGHCHVSVSLHYCQSQQSG